jgi:hypothetical protein
MVARSGQVGIAKSSDVTRVFAGRPPIGLRTLPIQLRDTVVEALAPFRADLEVPLQIEHAQPLLGGDLALLASALVPARGLDVVLLDAPAELVPPPEVE